MNQTTGQASERVSASRDFARRGGPDAGTDGMLTLRAHFMCITSRPDAASSDHFWRPRSGARAPGCVAGFILVDELNLHGVHHA